MKSVSNLNPTNLNPFSSRFVTPSTCSYVQDPAMAMHVDNAAQQLARTRCLQIVGPHGCGKTTFAIQIARQMHRAIDRIRLVTIKPGQTWTRLPKIFSQSNDGRSAVYDRQSTLLPCVIIDGVELLSPIARLCLIQSLKRCGGWTIFTLHRPTWLIRSRVTIEPSFGQFRRIALNLAARSTCQISDELMQTTYCRSNGNYRAAMSLLYDQPGR